MKKSPFNYDTIYDCVFKNHVPEVVVFPFYKSHVSGLSRLPIKLRLTSVLDDKKLYDHEILNNVVISVMNTNIIKDDNIFSKLSPMLNQYIVKEFVKWYTQWRKYFDENILDFSEQSKPMFQWELAKSIGIKTLFDEPYTHEQKIWLVCANFLAKKNDHKFMIDLVESLKPWINNELYHAVKKIENNKKTNIDYNKQREDMLSGSFGISENDQAIFDKLNNGKQEQLPTVQPIENDMDIIN